MNETMTRRNLLAGLAAMAAPLVIPVTAAGATAEDAALRREPLVEEWEDLWLSLRDEMLMANREDPEWPVNCALGELAAWPLTIVAQGHEIRTRGELIDALERLLQVLRQDVPIIDHEGDAKGPLPCSVIRLQPGTARVTHQEFER